MASATQGGDPADQAQETPTATTPQGRPTRYGPTPGTGSTTRTLVLGLAWLISLAMAFGLGHQTGSQRPAGAAASPTASSTGTSTSAPAQQQSQPPSQQQSEAAVAMMKQLPRRQPGDPLALGRVDAKVVMTEWSDFRCPFCAVSARRTHPALQPYVDNGTLRIEFRDMAIFGEQSVAVATAARAAGRQGRFWEFYHAVMDQAPTSGHPDYTDDQLLGFAQRAGVADPARFDAERRDPALRQAVLADTQHGQGLGISGTPFFVIGTTPISGAQPVDTFVQVVERHAKE